MKINWGDLTLLWNNSFTLFSLLCPLLRVSKVIIDMDSKICSFCDHHIHIYIHTRSVLFIDWIILSIPHNSTIIYASYKEESSYYSHSNPFNFPFPSTTNYIPKGILLFSLTQKVSQLFQKALLYDIICEIMLQIYCTSNNAIL